MLAVLELGGNQFIVRKGDVIDVKKIENKVGDIISIQPMLISEEDGKDAKIGIPLIEGSKVELKVLEQFKDEKVRVFKMKSKKRYSRNTGFRAQLTKLEVLEIA